MSHATTAYYENRIAELEGERDRLKRLVKSLRAGGDRMVTRCIEGANLAIDPAVTAAYASVLGALNDLTAPTVALGVRFNVTASHRDDDGTLVIDGLEVRDVSACCDGTHTRDCTGPCPDPDDVRDHARDRAADGA